MQGFCGLLSSLTAAPEAPVCVDGASGYDAYVNAYGAYIGAFKVCQEQRAECLGVMREAVTRGSLSALEASVAAAGVGAGFAETVASWVPAVDGATKELYVDGQAVASVAAECVSAPVGCAQRGRHWARNKARREKRKESKVAAAAEVVKGSSKSDALRESFDARRVVENELAKERAEAQLALLRDGGVRKMHVELEKRKLEGQVCSALVRSQKSMDDAASVRPESSVSQREAEAMKQQLDDAMFRMSVMEELAREKASREEFVEASRLAPMPTFVVPPLEAEVTMADRVRAVKEAFPELHPEHVAQRDVGVEF